MTVPSIPVVDFSDFDARRNVIAEQVFNACKTPGLFYIINHSLSSSQVAQAFDLSMEFFELPAEKKAEYTKVGESFEGYLSLYNQRSDYGNKAQPDHKEAYDFIPFRDDNNPSHPMPITFLEHKNDIEAFSKDLHAVALQVLELISMGLKLPFEQQQPSRDDGGTSDWLSQRHRYSMPKTPGVLRLQRYPRGDAEKHKDELQAGEHTDFGTITLLLHTDVPGLEVKLKENGEWISVPPLNGNAMIVNVAGMLSYWTHGLFHAPFHRVVFTPEQEKKDRYSIAYFLQPESGVKLTDMPSPVIPKLRPANEDVPHDIIARTSDDYLEYRYRKSVERQKDDH
ncbi:hypothetical protein BDB00DRAFT_808762 [Zychaea mexicana]|uniref:uncharacterized protein n=1 Tax=Zychaea mexicana TaxID=64656 RepID=UPI0022FE1990|nr:uncharacterized protein BDB00DRAFT_808762 [Zychaea mexicana]KAI9496407.1 hypothetical protein BDB00DRAFT_808762 [Zychaea mexicana]